VYEPAPDGKRRAFWENAMLNLSRRSLLAGAAAASVAPVTIAPAIAAAPAAEKQNPGVYRYKIGSHQISVVTDGVNRQPLPDTLVTNVKKEDVQAMLAASYMDTGTFFNTYGPIVVNTGSKLIVIDTGNGEAAYDRSKGAFGQLQTNLKAAGIDAKAVDTVVISHYHGDHVNGLLLADNSLAFPNAEILVPAEEHKFWMDDGQMSRASKGRMEDLFKNNRRVFSGEVLKHLHTYDWDKEIAPGITAVSTPGHSWAHTSFVVASGNQKVFVQSDVTHVPYLFARNPGWHAAVDQDGPQAEATRRRVYDMLAADKMMVQGFHYPFPGLAHIEKDANGYRAIPTIWNPAI
jgi:glyoxylase-like metal-dependent hydrolase (beta-lactamase superfamily II)